MAFSDQTCRAEYVTDGVIASFSIPFPFPSPDVVCCYLLPTGGTEQKYPADAYAVSGQAVVFNTPPEPGKLVVIREMPFVQEMDLIPNGDLPSQSVETSFDRLVMICIQLREELNRCIKLSITDGRNPMTVLTNIVDQAAGYATLAAQSANSAANSAETCAAIQYTISRVWQQLTNDPTFSTDAAALLADIAAAAGAIGTAREAAIAAINDKTTDAAGAADAALEAAKAAMTKAENSVVNAKDAAISYMDELGLSDAALLAKIAEAQGAADTLAAAMQDYDGTVNAALTAAQTKADNYLAAAKNQADKYLSDAANGIGDAKNGALSDIAAQVQAASGSASNAATSATLATQKALAATQAADAARAAQEGIGSVVNESLLAHNASTTAHPQLRNALNLSITAASEAAAAAQTKANAVEAALAALKTTPPGSVLAFAGSGDVPDGYLICDGATVSRTTYADLFAAIGTLWGTGDGETTFALPDLRGEFLRGYLPGTSGAIGSKQSEGLPAINGTLNGIVEGSGAWGVAGQVGSQYAIGTVSLAVSGIYGASEHVTPRNAAVQFIIRY